MQEPNGKIKTCFKYTDEYGDVTEVAREVPSDYLDLDEGDILCSLFKDFLISCGFIYPIGKKIVFEEDD